MPVIDGVKVACIPCIRGHRSTKCTHQAERIMIPVRKPGRPLSSCPHQKGKLCNCNNITAAIPRHGKCGCGTSEPPITETIAPVKTEPPVSDVAPMSPTKAASFRIQKHATPKSPSRKLSYDISLLGQMDPNTINVIPTHGMALGPNGNLPHASPMPSPGFISNFQPSFSSEGPMSQNLEYGRMLGRLEGAALNTFFESSVPNPLSSDLSSNGTSGHSSLDASGASRYTSVSKSPNPNSYTKRFSTEGAGCCGKRSAMPLVNEQLEERESPQNGLGLMRYGDPIPTHGQSLSTLDFDNTINDRPNVQHTQQNTAYTYPVSYGSSFYEPLQFSQWQEMMINQSHSMPTQNAYMGSQSRMEAAAPVPDSYTAQQCGCGEGCQCLGCATHPFNSAMQEYVLSALQEGQSISPSLSNGDIHAARNGTSETSPGVLASPIANGSPASETGSTGMNDYLFVSYCPGSPQSCPCGDECACVGCMIHCNPGSRNPPTPP
ncbi:hypothetical protein F5Y03DRAFT_22969 [Xylaria venustula]|nr:hypothetical protein F5Y03DRAFT_22969 [Xylaria venustula]